MSIQRIFHAGLQKTIGSRVVFLTCSVLVVALIVVVFGTVSLHAQTRNL